MQLKFMNENVNNGSKTILTGIGPGVWLVSAASKGQLTAPDADYQGTLVLMPGGASSGYTVGGASSPGSGVTQHSYVAHPTVIVVTVPNAPLEMASDAEFTADILLCAERIGP